MPIDIFDPGDPESRPYRFPYFPRELTGEPMLSAAPFDQTPRPGILNGRVYARCVPVPAGARVHRRPDDSLSRFRHIEFTIPDGVPDIDPDTMQEREP